MRMPGNEPKPESRRDEAPAETLTLAPEPGQAIVPGDATAYEAPYARYRELYPRLYGRDE